MEHTRRSRSSERATVVLSLLAVCIALTLVCVVLVLAAWQFAQLPAIVAAGLRVALFLAPLLLAVAAGVVALVACWRRYATHAYIKAEHVTRLTRAQGMRFPDSLTSLSFHDSSRPALPAPAPDEVPALPAPAPVSSVPTFAQLLDAGQVAAGRPMLLGYRADTAQPIAGSWQDLYSVGVGGMTGSGKSTLIAFLVAQSVLHGARLIVVDPHAGDPQSLATRLAGLSSAYMCDAASDSRSIEQALKLARDKLTARMQGRGGSWPIVLVVDEWTSLLRGSLCDLLTSTALDIAEQGRKYNVFALLAAQAWQIDAAGSVRDRLASHYTMRTRGEQFRYQTGLRGSAPLDTMFLKPGTGYLLSNRGDLSKVVIPEVEATDLARVGAQLDTSRAVSGQPFGFTRTQVVASADSSGTAAGQQRDSRQQVLSSAAVPAESARAVDLFLAGRDLPQIVQELRGIDPSRGGRAYREASKEISDLLRQVMKGI